VVKEADLGVGWPQILVLPLTGRVIIAKLHYIFLGTTKTAVITIVISYGGCGIK